MSAVDGRLPVPLFTVIGAPDIRRYIDTSRDECLEVVRTAYLALASGEIVGDPDRAAVFSPFGLGVLDLALGKQVYQHVVAGGGGQQLADFFDEVGVQ